MKNFIYTLLTCQSPLWRDFAKEVLEDSELKDLDFFPNARYLDPRMSVREGNPWKGNRIFFFSKKPLLEIVLLHHLKTFAIYCWEPEGYNIIGEPTFCMVDRYLDLNIIEIHDLLKEIKRRSFLMPIPEIIDFLKKKN